MAGLRKSEEAFDSAGVQIVAVTSESEKEARKMQEDEDLRFPVLYGTDIDEMSERLGLYVRRNEKRHVQPAQFILDPEGEIHLASYSSERIGRVRAEEALEMIEAERD